MNKLNPILCIGLLGALASHADLIAGWDFQTTTSGGTAVTAWNATTFPRVYVANVGLGSLYLDGTNGSSSWDLTAASTTTELNAFGGTATNAGAGMSTVTTSPSSLALVNSSANGNSAVFSFSMNGYENLVVSYATQRTTTGFNSQAWDYSTDGSAWTPVQTFTTTIPTGFGTLTTSNISGLDNSTTAYLRLTVDGASSVTGNNRLDNIQFNAAPIAVPEPASAGLLVLGLLLLRRLRR